MEKIMEKESIFTPTFVINTLISFLFYIVFYDYVNDSEAFIHFRFNPKMCIH